MHFHILEISINHKYKCKSKKTIQCWFLDSKWKRKHTVDLNRVLSFIVELSLRLRDFSDFFLEIIYGWNHVRMITLESQWVFCKVKKKLKIYFEAHEVHCYVDPLSSFMFFWILNIFIFLDKNLWHSANMNWNIKWEFFKKF